MTAMNMPKRMKNQEIFKIRKKGLAKVTQTRALRPISSTWGSKVCVR